MAAVNPWLIASWQRSTGSITQADGTRTPTFASGGAVQVQCQALTFQDLNMLDGLNINGVKQALYVNGNIQGVSRPEIKGGDMFTLSDGSVWLVALVIENWNRTGGWTKCAVVLQNDANAQQAQ